MQKTNEAPKQRFQIAKLEPRIAPAIITTHVNAGGNTPKGQAHGVPTIATNPAGHAPPGQNA